MLRCSRVELVGREDLEVDLVVGEIPVPSSSKLEDWAAKPRTDIPVTPATVGALPAGPTWPLDADRLGSWRHRRRTRTITAVLMVVAGLLDIIGSFLPAFSDHVERVEKLVPFHAHHVAGVLGILAGVALIGLSFPVLRGYRPAYLATLAVLGVSTVSMLTHSAHVFQSFLAIGVLLWLLAKQGQFRVMPAGRSRWGVWALTLALGAVAFATILMAAFGRDEQLTRNGIALAGGVLIAARRARRPARALEARSRARSGPRPSRRPGGIIARHGGDTLDYFALRDDKELLFSGDGLVAYTVLDRTMLISPDPICAPDQRASVMVDAVELADRNGWDVSVLAANASWLPIYHALGMHEIYMGDEAILDCSDFTLNGRAMKSLRGTWNRVHKLGYRVEMHDPAEMDPAMQAALTELMTETRQGDTERGFSMTLSRIFDPRDTGLLLAVCLDPDGRPVAFNQYVPAPDIGGWSLDLMRRTNDPDAPNGLTDFVVIETALWMQAKGQRGLCLNFAVMRAVLAGELGDGPWRTVEQKTMHHFSESMQIESLWKFNEKYDPVWRPRYVVTDAEVERARAGIAVARAESFVELPVVGHLLKPPKAHPTDPGDAGDRRRPRRRRRADRVSISPHLRGARRDLTGEGDQPAGPGESLARGAGRTLGVVGLALVLLSAMDSIRNLPSSATFGWACIFFYVVAVVTYLIPVAFTSAELATTWPEEGGIYAWVREAFGSRWGFLAVWCDWSENLAWFPTVLLFLATTVAYVVDPDLSSNRAFLVVTMLGIFWGTTIAAMAGASRVAHWIGRLVIVGTAVPTVIIIVLGLWWFGSGKPSQIPYSSRRHHPGVGGPGQPRLHRRHRRGLRRHGDRRLLRPPGPQPAQGLPGGRRRGRRGGRHPVDPRQPRHRHRRAQEGHQPERRGDAGPHRLLRRPRHRVGDQAHRRARHRRRDRLAGLVGDRPRHGHAARRGRGQHRPVVGPHQRPRRPGVGAAAPGGHRLAAQPAAAVRRQHQHLLLDAHRARGPDLPGHVPADVRRRAAPAPHPARRAPAVPHPRRQGRPRAHRRRRHRRLGVHLRARLPARQPPLGRGHGPLRPRHGAGHRRRVRHPVPAPPRRRRLRPRPGAGVAADEYLD